MQSSPVSEDAKTFLKTISLENLIDGFPAWWRVFSSVVTHPFRFASSLKLDAPQALVKAVRYFLYSILVEFVLMAPVFLAHHTKMNKILFVARFCCQFFVYGLVMHYAYRLLGAKQALRGSLASYIYLAATGMQLYLLLALPWLIKVGPDAVFGGLAEVQTLQAQVAASERPRFVAASRSIFYWPIFPVRGNQRCEGFRSCLPLRGSPGFAPGSLWAFPPVKRHQQARHR